MNEIELVALVEEMTDSMSLETVAAGDLVEWFLPPELSERDFHIVEAEMARRYPGAEVRVLPGENSCIWHHDFSHRAFRP